MKYLSNRQKLKKAVEQNQKNLNDLSKKLKDYEISQTKENHLKFPKIIYESDWIEPGTVTENYPLSKPGYPEDPVEGNQDFYFYYPDSTAKKGQQTPFQLEYHFFKELEIYEKYTPFVKSTILVSKTPELNVEGVMDFQNYIYDDELGYYQIKGDNTLIYQGHYPQHQLHPYDGLGKNFHPSLVSKWYYNDMKWNVYDWSDPTTPIGKRGATGYLNTIDTYWDIVPLAGHVGLNSYKRFRTTAIDNVRNTSVSGTGTFETVTAFEDLAGSGQYIKTTTQNVCRTAPLFAGLTIVNGYVFSNEDYQGILGSVITYKNVITKFSNTWDNPRKYWKLFYSNKKAREFRFSIYGKSIVYPPSAPYYQGGILPYLHFYVKENPSLSDFNPEQGKFEIVNYPVIKETEMFSSIVFSKTTEDTWTKVATNKYNFHKKGKIILSSPAKEPFDPYQADSVDEKYSKTTNYPYTYSRDKENREPKDMPVYKPQTSDIKIKLILMIHPPIDFEEEKHTTIKDFL